MEEQPGHPGIPPLPPDDGPPTPAGFVPPVPRGPEADALEAERAALRQRIDAGAATPEELRALAAQMREVRQREELLWRSEVRPALVKARKGRLRLGDLREGQPSDAPADPAVRSLAVGLAVLGAVVVVVLLATQSSVLWVLLPLVAVLAYAWRQGRTGGAGPSGDLGAPDS